MVVSLRALRLALFPGFQPHWDELNTRAANRRIVIHKILMWRMG